MKKLLLLLLITLSNANSQNLALNKPVYVSSVESPGTNAKHYVNDGDYSTYWASAYNDGEWVYIDLQDEYNLGELKIHWEGSYSKRYAIEISSDNSSYDTVYSEENGDGGEDSINLNGVTGRYLKINCFERASVYGNAIYEIEVFANSLIDGSDTDQDGNSFDWINYGTEDWSVENAEVVTYRDGTPIPLVNDNNEWHNLTSGAWCYVNNDSTKGRLYNWYAVAGVYDEASFNDRSLRKEFAPDGWRVPNNNDWNHIVQYLYDNGYNYDGTLNNQLRINKALASKIGWDVSTIEATPGNNPHENNESGFNAKPLGSRGNGNISGNFYYLGNRAFFWEYNNFNNYVAVKDVRHNSEKLWNVGYGDAGKYFGFSVRFVRDASTASTKDYSNSITIYPNPTSSIINIEQDFTSAKVYDISGKEILKSTSKTIDLSELPSSIYLLRLYDNSNKVLGTSKVVKQ